MKVEFELKKIATEIDGKQIEYYVLERKLVNGELMRVTIKGDKAKLLLMSLAIEKEQK